MISFPRIFNHMVSYSFMDKVHVFKDRLFTYSNRLFPPFFSSETFLGVMGIYVSDNSYIDDTDTVS